jgi:hypothetical protein
LGFGKWLSGHVATIITTVATWQIAIFFAVTPWSKGNSISPNIKVEINLSSTSNLVNIIAIYPVVASKSSLICCRNRPGHDSPSSSIISWVVFKTANLMAPFLTFKSVRHWIFNFFFLFLCFY